MVYFTESVDPLDRVVHIEFTNASGSSWYAAEFDPARGLFYGYSVIDNDVVRGSWGYFALDYLRSLTNPYGKPSVMELSGSRFDYPRLAKEIRNIAVGYRVRGEWDGKFPAAKENDSNPVRTEFEQKRLEREQKRFEREQSRFERDVARLRRQMLNRRKKS